jgi:hypothetical protein
MMVGSLKRADHFVFIRRPVKPDVLPVEPDVLPVEPDVLPVEPDVLPVEPEVNFIITLFHKKYL